MRLANLADHRVRPAAKLESGAVLAIAMEPR